MDALEQRASAMERLLASPSRQRKIRKISLLVVGGFKMRRQILRRHAGNPDRNPRGAISTLHTNHFPKSCNSCEKRAITSFRALLLDVTAFNGPVCLLPSQGSSPGLGDQRMRATMRSRQLNCPFQVGLPWPAYGLPASQALRGFK